MKLIDREFVFNPEDFERIRLLIRSRVGIALSDKKRDLVYSRIARRLRSLGLRTFSDYLDYLAQEQDEMQDFINALTTNLTSFFREAHHFDFLADQMRQVNALGQMRRFTIWSSACSTGEEAYSIAMTAIETFGSWTPPVKILATDVDTHVLAQARQGVYGLERIEKMDVQRLKAFFLKGKGDRQGSVKIRPEVQALVSFQQLNLLAPSWHLRGPFDAIFCRNVMIYFDKPTQYSVLEKFHPLLNESGLLYAGHSESFQHAANLFKSKGKTIYQPVRLASNNKVRR
ncbi:CheR family methyltransferase [Nitrincola tibetensis]|uniref:CheR family methyltransferase n=1 Tax=Nitrincola tibetensis TaxID=2219697 RepID=UPI001EFCEA55|nr:CheR family methyltransferase [Nitrincola tibetensis]